MKKIKPVQFTNGDITENKSPVKVKIIDESRFEIDAISVEEGCVVVIECKKNKCHNVKVFNSANIEDLLNNY